MTDADIMRDGVCPACGYMVSVPFYDGGEQPLATIAWPGDENTAKELPRLPLDYVRCAGCGHVYNAAFDYKRIPYNDKPNLMFNQGQNWSEFIKNIRSRMLGMLPAHPSVVEIGYGDGSFLASLAEGGKDGRYIGFDPHGAKSRLECLQLRGELFDPGRHLAELKPNIIIMRHVLEHLVNPLKFLQQIGFMATALDMKLLCYLEVPCIDRAIEAGRTVDFYYEHNSQFTTQSFERMVVRSGADIVEIGHGYDREVVYGFMRFMAHSEQMAYVREARDFMENSARAVTAITSQLDALYKNGKRVAIWGGTGKSAAFMQRYNVDSERFPVVIDDDKNKVDTYVPGTGQKIRYRDWLAQNPVDVIIIPPQWRAFDILASMRKAGIQAPSILIEHQGSLVDLISGNHPYRPSSS